MKLQRVSIKNFKSIPPTGVNLVFLERLIFLVGKNNAGKSNILEAIGLLFGSKNPRYVSFPSDCFNDAQQAIVIEAVFEGLTWGDGCALGLSNPQCGMLTREGKRVQTQPGHVTFRLTVPPRKEEPAEADESNGEDDDSGEAKQTFAVYLANKDEMKRNEEFRRALVKHICVPPVRSCGDILAPSTWTSYGRMVHEILAESDQLDDLRNLIAQATERLRGVLQAEAKTLTENAKTTAYVDAIDFRFTKDGNPSELLRNLSLSVTYGGRTEDISCSGTGTQSAVIIGVLELCLRHRTRHGLRVFAVEEPELFLHPHAQRHVASLLRRIAQDRTAQVIVTTHSPSILAQTDMLDVVRVDRAMGGGTRCCRVDATFNGLSAWERTLTVDSAEMVFADRAVLVEGPSEMVLLPRIARAVKDSQGQSLDPDRRNVSFVNVGGKEKFGVFTTLLDQLNIEWRILADADALNGETLADYKSRARVAANLPAEEQRRELLKIGVAVLSKGEIEDYYPLGALAEIAGCTAEQAQEEIDGRRLECDDPTARQLVENVVVENQEAIGAAPKPRLPKLVKCWYDQTLQRLRQGESLGQTERKTGDVLARWLKMGKPEIAQHVSQWMLANESHIPEALKALAHWLVTGTWPIPTPTPVGNRPSGE